LFLDDEREKDFEMVTHIVDDISLIDKQVDIKIRRFDRVDKVDLFADILICKSLDFW
jgi:hypothetical protein